MNSNDEIMKDYFKSWLTHDVEALRKLFIPACTYEIKGKSKLAGIEPLCDYWQRNKKRQQNIDIFDPIILEGDANSMRVAFCATFLDLEEHQNQTVFGEIKFQFEDGKISNISEKYRVHREKSNYIFWERLGRAKSYFVHLIRKTAQNHLPRLLQVTSFVLALITFYFYYNTNRLPDFAVCLLNGKFNSPGCEFSMAGDRDAMVASAYRVLGIIAAVLLVIIPFVSMYSARLRFGRVRTTELNRTDHDLDLMRKSFKSAKGLIIFSGDFSFVRDNEEFFPIFRRLANRDALHIISDAPKARVIAGFGGTPEATSLIDSLEAEKKIIFESPTPIKCSIVRKWDGSEVLYRFEGNGAGSESSQLYMCEVKRRGDIGPVVDLIEHLSKVRVSG